MKETLKGSSKKNFLTEILSRLRIDPNPQLLKEKEEEEETMKTVNTYKTTAK